MECTPEGDAERLVATALGGWVLFVAYSAAGGEDSYAGGAFLVGSGGGD